MRRSESTTIMAGIMAADGRDGLGTIGESVYPDPQWKTERPNWIKGLLTSKLTSSVTLPSRLYFLILPNPFHQLGPRNQTYDPMWGILFQSITFHSLTPIGLWPYHNIKFIQSYIYIIYKYSPYICMSSSSLLSSHSSSTPLLILQLAWTACFFNSSFTLITSLVLFAWYSQMFFFMNFFLPWDSSDNIGISNISLVLLLSLIHYEGNLLLNAIKYFWAKV